MHSTARSKERGIGADSVAGADVGAQQGWSHSALLTPSGERAAVGALHDAQRQLQARANECSHWRAESARAVSRLEAMTDAYELRGTRLKELEPHPELATGRYIDREDEGDVVDTVSPQPVEMTDARQLDEPATLERMGFCLEKHPTAVRDFRDDKAVGEIYYEEVRELVKRASGASRVFVFDHTVDSEQNDLNLAPARRHVASTPSTWPSESWRRDCPFHTDPRNGRQKPQRGGGRRRGARAAGPLRLYT